MITIPLETNWTCDYFELEPDLYEFSAAALQVPYLSDWHCERRYDDGWAAWLERHFTIEPTDAECMTYALVAVSVPAGTRIYLNRHQVAEPASGGALDIDVTFQVALDDNTIALRVPCGSTGSFNGVRLRGVPCP